MAQASPTGSVDLCSAVLDSIPGCAILFATLDGEIRLANAGIADLLGWQSTELIGKPVSEICALDLGRAESQPVTDLIGVRRRDGSELFAECTMAPVKVQAAVAGYSVTLRDATALRKAQQSAERATEELGRFAFTVSHDLQEPLRGVRAYAELLERRYKGRLDSDADEFIQFMIDGVNRMNQLLKDILAYSQAGREDRTRPEVTDANAVFQWALMNIDAPLKQIGGTITHDPLPRVWADQNQLATLFQHLLSNSIKFHGPEPLQIHVGARELEDWYEFCVRDNGIGVPADQTERVFGIFKRLHGREVPGTGVGLSICRKIVEAHGGRIWMESEAGEGATVRFTLPTHE